MNLNDCINIIKNCTTLACEYHIKGKCDYGYEVRENRFECAKEIAVKAIKKQIEKKPKGIHCGSCNYVLIMSHDLYCPRCGQKVNWKGENENE